jgi:hypothetical protein
MACLCNYTVQCVDVASGKTGCFFYDEAHWQKTGEFIAVGEVFPDLYAFYKGTKPEQRKSCYLERESQS